MQGMDLGNIIWSAGAMFLFALGSIPMLIGLWQMRNMSSRLQGAGAVMAAFLCYYMALNLLMTIWDVRPPLPFAVAWCTFGLLIFVSDVTVAVLYALEWYANRTKAAQPNTQMQHQGRG